MSMPAREYPKYIFGMALLPIFVATHRFWMWYDAVTAPHKGPYSIDYDGTNKGAQTPSRRATFIPHEGSPEEVLVDYHR